MSGPLGAHNAMEYDRKNMITLWNHLSVLMPIFCYSICPWQDGIILYILDKRYNTLIQLVGDYRCLTSRTGATQ